jgi:CBS domain containing-hemolysin-like protein
LYEKVASDIVLPLDKVFKLPYHLQVTDKVLMDILDHGHSRVPIWKDHEDNIVGLLLVKHLIRLKPNKEKVHVSDLQIMPLFQVKENFSLFGLLRCFQTGASHMAIVTRGMEISTSGVISSSPVSAPNGDNVFEGGNDYRTRAVSSDVGTIPMTRPDQVPLSSIGIITLEDVLEKLLKRTIEDETDILKPVVQTLDTRLSQVRSLRDGLLQSLEHSKGDNELGELDSLTGGDSDGRRSSYGSLNDFEQANGKIVSSTVSSAATKPVDSSVLLRMMGGGTLPS